MENNLRQYLKVAPLKEKQLYSSKKIKKKNTVKVLRSSL